MDFDKLLKRIQQWTNSVPLVILGSGASVPFNLPSMWQLGEHLKNTLKFSDADDQKQFQEFKDTLEVEKDLEITLQKLQLKENVTKAIISETWKLINNHDLKAYDSLLAPKVNFPLSELTKHLLSPAQQKLVVITTNYDRLAEYAASFANAFICTGYTQNFVGQFSNKIHTNNLSNLKGYSGQVNIWKVHGSLDWFKDANDVDIQLPLRERIPDKYQPSIVTPGSSKYPTTHLEPFRTILTAADTEIENANGYLCIGYGFNDIHVQPKLISQIKNSKPIIVITKKLTKQTMEAIIGNSCKNYVLIEEADPNDTRIYSSNFTGPEIVKNVSYWELGEYLSLIRS